MRAVPNGLRRRDGARKSMCAWHPIFGPEADYRNPDQWEFYVVPATSLPDGRRTIGRTGIKKLTVPVKLEELGGAVQSLAVVGPPDNGARTPLV
jgi:hypothetical protein